MRREDGAALPSDQAVTVLRAALRRRTEQLRRLRAIPGVREAVRADRARAQQEAVYPPGRPAMD